MSLERSHGKLRVIPARLSDHADHADGANAVDRDRDHAQNGQFKEQNQAATGTGAKRTIRNLVPLRGRKVFDALCTQIGGDGGALAYMHAADCVSHQLMAGELTALAREKGLATTDGLALDERATRHSEAALRAATAALDVSRLLKKVEAKAITDEPVRLTDDRRICDEEDE